MRTGVRAPSALIIAAMAWGGFTGCGDEQTHPAASPSATASPSTTATAVAANRLQLCDHARDAFRSGGLDDARQSSALAAELQGMMVVADPDEAQVLQPMADAASAIAEDGRKRARPALRRAETRSYGELRRACVPAGSQVWSA